MTSMQDIECPKEFYVDELPVNPMSPEMTDVNISFGHIGKGIWGHLIYRYNNYGDFTDCVAEVGILDDTSGRKWLFSQNYSCNDTTKSPYKFSASAAKKYHIPEILHLDMDVNELERIIQEAPGIDTILEEALRVKKNVIVGEWQYKTAVG